MKKLPPYISIDANGRISRAEPPQRFKRPRGVDAGLSKAVIFVALIAVGIGMMFEVTVDLLRSL